MLSIDECKNSLEKEGNKFTNEEIKKIKEILYNMARVELEKKGKNERVYKKS